MIVGSYLPPRLLRSLWRVGGVGAKLTGLLFGTAIYHRPPAAGWEVQRRIVGCGAAHLMWGF